MKTQTSWGYRSFSWWITLLMAAGIIFVGARFIIAPAAGAEGFGIPFASPRDWAYGRIKGIRDIFSGVVLLPLLWMRMRVATAWVFTSAILVPATDCMIVLTTNGAQDLSHLLIHGGTALFMAGVSVLLFRKELNP